MLVLGIESSCDETGVALYDTERGLLAHRLHTQMAMHAEYGGVVPELASRDHIRRLVPLTQSCLQEAGAGYTDIDAVAFTQGPGLGGALLAGSGYANALAFALGKPVVPVHHLEGHLLSPLLADEQPPFPFVALLVSGGHTQLMAVRGIGDYTLLGESVDDAAGEAFDKTAKLLGLPYPGGARLSELAKLGRPDVFNFPRPMLHSHDLQMSFSGLKTSVLTTVQKTREAHGGELPDSVRNNICRAFQDAVVDVLAAKAAKALQQTGTPFGAYACNIFQPAGAGACAGSLRAHAGNGKAVGFVSDMGHQHQGCTVGGKGDFGSPIGKNELLQAYLATLAFLHPYEQANIQPQLFEDGACGGYLAFATVDQHQVGHAWRIRLRLEQLAIAALEDLAHGGVVVTRGDVVDAVATVRAVLHTVLLKDNA